MKPATPKPASKKTTPPNIRLIITGTPGTGKTTLAKKISRLTGAALLDANKIAIAKGFFAKQKGIAEKIVDTHKLSIHLNKILSREKNFVAEGHLLCEFNTPADAIIVLRCDPRELEKRLEKRKYPEKKIRENLMAEYLDYCLLKAQENYGEKKTVQINATKFPDAKKALIKARKRKSDSVNWAPLLQKTLCAKNGGKRWF